MNPGREVTAALPDGPGHDGGIGDWPPNLFVRIATPIGRRRQEDVASAALLYMIQADSNARRALVADLARRAGLTVGVDLPGDLYFVGQDHGTDGRPDIVGVDDSARARIVIEARSTPGSSPVRSPATAPAWSPACGHPRRDLPTSGWPLGPVHLRYSPKLFWVIVDERQPARPR